MNRLIKITLLAIAIFSSILLKAQEIKLKAELDTVIILIGDQAKLHVEVEFPANINVLFPVPDDSLSEFVEIVERLPMDSILLENDRKILAQDFIVTSFDTGHHEIPPFEFALSYGEMSDTASSNATMLHVFTIPKLDSLMSVMKGPIDIKAPYEAPLSLKEVAPWILGSLLVAGLIFLILYALRRKRNNQPIFSLPQKPKEPAHIVAIRKLDSIKEEKIWQQGKSKEYYSAVTDTLREYIEERFGINAMEQTSEETIKEFKFRKDLLDQTTFENLQRILSSADLVKFAKFEPLPDDNNLVLVDSYFFVNQTKLIEQVAEPDSEEKQDGEEVDLK